MIFTIETKKLWICNTRLQIFQQICLDLKSGPSDSDPAMGHTHRAVPTRGKPG